MIDEIRCLRCNARFEEIEFCNHGEIVSPTPFCEVCGDCICEKNGDSTENRQLMEIFYSGVSSEILDELPRRREHEEKLLSMFRNSTHPLSSIDHLRSTFTPIAVNQMLRFIVNGGIRRYLVKAINEDLLPARSLFSRSECSVFRTHSLYPIKVFNFGSRSKGVVLLAGTAHTLKGLSQLELGREEVVFVGVELNESPKLLVDQYQEERDYTHVLRVFRAWVERVRPEFVRFTENGIPQCLIGKKWVKPQGFDSTDEWISDAERLKDGFADSSEFSFRFTGTTDNSIIMTVSPTRISEDSLWPTCERVWKELLIALERASGILLIASHREEVGSVRQFLMDRLKERLVEFSDFSNWGIDGSDFYAGNVVFADHTHLKTDPHDLIDLSQSVPVILFYTGIHPSEYLRERPIRRRFEACIVGHYLFTSFRPLCKCAEGVSSHAVKIANGRIVDADFLEPKGCGQCYDSGYRDKYLLLFPYEALVPEPDGDPFIDQKMFDDFLGLKVLDFFYASRLFGACLKNQTVVARLGSE
ncbi:hypothetical protein L0156_02235 [bacterium]|nr:hypothetical protein [bacterium]